MSYRQLIEKAAPGSKPRQIEALMRDKFGTLDNLSPDEFRCEAQFAAFVVGKGMELAERLADSMGLPQ